MKLFPMFLLLIVRLSRAYAQEVTFSELSPTHKPDSLENWLTTYKTPNVTRLKNMIILGRTYTSSNINKLTTHLDEINLLANKFNSPLGKASYHYLKAYYYKQYQHSYSAFKELQEAMIFFQKTNDDSGLLHCYSLLLMMQFTITAEDRSKDELLKKQYLSYIQQYLGNSPDIHNYIQAQFAIISYEYGKEKKKDGKKLEQLVRNALAVVNRNKELAYAYFRLNIFLAISYYYQDRVEDSYKLNVSVLQKLNPSQTHELITIYYNLSNDCLYLNKNEEGITRSQQSIALIEKYEPENYGLKSALYGNLKEFMRSKKRWNESIALADSMLNYEKLANQKSNDTQMLELQSKYEFKQKQREITSLQKEQQRNIWLLVIAAVVITVVAFLGYKLYRANQILRANKKLREQLFGIIAHDLRRPMHAFHRMGELINFHLKRKEYDKIELFSQALDESGLAIQRLLDNLLSWVLSQHYILSYNPISIPLHKPVNSVVDLYRQVSVSKNIAFQVDCSPSIMVYADANALELIIRNLIDNAYKATPINGKIVVKAEMLPSQMTSLTISDNGSGMNDSMLTKSRSTFLQPEMAQIGESGIGMGLPMVARFVKKNRGHIWVESSPNTGTTFIIEIPTTAK